MHQCWYFFFLKLSWLFKFWHLASLQSFKKRFFYLKQQVDTSYVLEYHKDDKKLDVKGVIYLDSLVEVVKVFIKTLFVAPYE